VGNTDEGGNVTLQDALRELAKARKQHEIAHERTDKHLNQVKGLSVWRKMLEAQDLERDCEIVTKRAESMVRELALVEHALTGDAKPAEGVQIKEFTKVVYAPNLALDWCRAHAPKYLQLDTKAFEKAAPVLKDLGAPVELTKEPRLQIATDLSAWLPDPLLASEEINVLREEQELAEKELYRDGN
jgi:hypothetical protein